MFKAVKAKIPNYLLGPSSEELQRPIVIQKFVFFPNKRLIWRHYSMFKNSPIVPHVKCKYFNEIRNERDQMPQQRPLRRDGETHKSQKFKIWYMGRSLNIVGKNKAQSQTGP